MDFAHDTDMIEDVVLRRDPAFRAVDPQRIRRKLDRLRNGDHGADPDAYLFAAMEVLALAENGHTRLIPNAAIKVLPVRFVAIGSSFVATDGTGQAAVNRMTKLLAVNGVPVEDLFARACKYLAGTPARQRVIGAILFAWPGALNQLGAASGTGRVTYTVAAPDGDNRRWALHENEAVPARRFYPDSEHGSRTHPRRPADRATCTMMGAGAIHVRLTDFLCKSADGLERDLSRAAGVILAKPDIGIVFDMRGNPGGDFLRTMGFIETLSEKWRGERYAVLVDKFTFSAAIVFVAILTQKLTASGRIIGEPMGDGTRFYAEGGTVMLPQTGAAVRYSTAFHDWQTGQAAPSTPPDIAPHLVAAGDLAPDQTVEITVADLGSGADPPLAAALEYVGG